MTGEDGWEDINEQVKEEWKAETTSFERVYEILEHTRDEESTADIADRSFVSESTARRHLKILVETRFAFTSQDGRTTLYKRDEDRALMTRIQRLRDQAS